MSEANDFDAIEDEEGGFDKELLEIYQRNHGSRPMADYDAFVGIASLAAGCAIASLAAASIMFAFHYFSIWS